MKLNVAVQMDPIARIKIQGDSTFALLLEAQKRGHELSYYTPDKLSLLGDELVAPVQLLSVRDDPRKSPTLIRMIDSSARNRERVTFDPIGRQEADPSADEGRAPAPTDPGQPGGFPRDRIDAAQIRRLLGHLERHDTRLADVARPPHDGRGPLAHSLEKFPPAEPGVRPWCQLI